MSEVDEKTLHTGITVSACGEPLGVEFRLSDKKLIFRTERMSHQKSHSGEEDREPR